MSSPGTVVPYSRFLAKQIKCKALSLLPENRQEPTLTIDMLDIFVEIQEGIRTLEKLIAEDEEEHAQIS
jgi:hypothetical protein